MSMSSSSNAKAASSGESFTISFPLFFPALFKIQICGHNKPCDKKRQQYQIKYCQINADNLRGSDIVDISHLNGFCFSARFFAGSETDCSVPDALFAFVFAGGSDAALSFCCAKAVTVKKRIKTTSKKRMIFRCILISFFPGNENILSAHPRQRWPYPLRYSQYQHFSVFEGRFDIHGFSAL